MIRGLAVASPGACALPDLRGRSEMLRDQPGIQAHHSNPEPLAEGLGGLLGGDREKSPFDRASAELSRALRMISRYAR
jgi:hypothetical protein